MRGKLLFVLACIVPGLMLLAGQFATGNAAHPDGNHRYSIIQKDGEQIAGLFITDTKSSQCISIVSDRNMGPFIAFYDATPGNRRSLPSIALGINGLQLVSDDGAIRFISVEELASLDRDKAYPLSAAKRK